MPRYHYIPLWIRQSLWLLALVPSLPSLATGATFDPPRTKRTVDLGPVLSSSDAHIKINCYYYARFMIKEVDLGEKGADRLAIVPFVRGVVPLCARTQAKNEMVINSDEWTGYFKGVKNGLVFFDADDGVDGGLGFAVYNPRTGKKLFDDSAFGPLDFSDTAKGPLTIRYTRVFESKCNVLQEPTCWVEIQKAIAQENISPPDCTSGYEKSAQELARGRCQAQGHDDQDCINQEIKLARNQTGAAPSVIVYPVEVVLTPQPVIKPLPGEIKCWPSD